MKTYFKILTVSTVLMSIVITSSFAQDTSRVSSTFIGSHGYLIESNSSKIALDAHIFWEGSNYGYIKPPPHIKDKIENAESPFDDIDLILISHAHSDHYNIGLLNASMLLNPEAVIVAPREVYDEIIAEAPNIDDFLDRVWSPEIDYYQTSDTVINTISLTITRIEHGDIGLLVYSILIDGMRLLQMNGWNSITGEMYDTLGFNKIPADVTYLGYDYLLDDAKFNLFANHLNTSFSTISHIDNAGTSRYNAIQEKIEEYEAEYPMNLLYSPIESLLFTKTEDTLIVDTTNQAAMLHFSIPDTGCLLGEVFEYEIPAGYCSDPEGGELVLSANLSNGNDLPEWLTFNGSTGIFNGTANDAGSMNISVGITDEQGATIYDFFRLTITDATRVSTNMGNLQLKLYPVPARTELIIQTDVDLSHKFSYHVIDLTGKTVLEGILSSKRIDIAELNSGSYILRLQSNGQMYTQKFLVE